MSGTAPEEIVRRRWRWLRFGEEVLRLIEDALAYLLENFPSVSDFDEAHRDNYSYAFANLGMLLASEDPDEDSNIGYCEFETAPDLRAHLDGMKSLQRLSGDLFVPSRESVGRERIEAVLDVVKQCMGDLDWHGDWSEEEWVLVHYWSTQDGKVNG